MILTRLLAGSTVALLLACIGLWVALAGKDVTIAELKESAAKLDAAIAEQRADAEASARATEQAQRAEMDRIGAEHAQALQAAQTRADSAAAALRAGTLSLRREWASCETGRLVSETAGAAGSADAGASGRADLVAAVLRVGSECDAWVRGLQEVVKACR